MRTSPSVLSNSSFRAAFAASFFSRSLCSALCLAPSSAFPSSSCVRLCWCCLTSACSLANCSSTAAASAASETRLLSVFLRSCSTVASLASKAALVRSASCRLSKALEWSAAVFSYSAMAVSVRFLSSARAASASSSACALPPGLHSAPLFCGDSCRSFRSSPSARRSTLPSFVSCKAFSAFASFASSAALVRSALRAEARASARSLESSAHSLRDCSTRKRSSSSSFAAWMARCCMRSPLAFAESTSRRASERTSSMLCSATAGAGSPAVAAPSCSTGSCSFAGPSSTGGGSCSTGGSSFAWPSST
mmetsp:Transcript_69870/g.216081  ORF Transcript_69870/g.216081 Transcript_69870/m.216081 type:complete len:307 (-) Transcript_69870:173-1093(-)